MPSAMNCLNSRQDDAPIAVRTAISRCLDSARASSRLATLTQAISSTKHTAPISISNAGRTLLTTSDCNG